MSANALVWPRVLRWTAVAIAVVAAIDPSFTTARRTDATVAVVAAEPRDSVLAERVANELEDVFTIVRGPFTAASATVLVGSVVPYEARAFAAPVVVVVPDRPVPRVQLQHVAVPASASPNTRVAVDVMLHVVGGEAREVAVSLRSGEVVLDRVPVRVASADEHIRLPLAYIPSDTGSNVVRVTAALPGADTVSRDYVVDVRPQRLNVLFLDARPSWMSTFVRRALEQDARFAVTSRVVTSRGVATEIGGPPADPNAGGALAGYDAIVIGAPTVAGGADAVAIERYLRERGGAAVLLLEGPNIGGYAALEGATSWMRVETDTAIVAHGASAVEGLQLRTRDFALPRPLPARAVVLSDASGRPAVWRTPIGAGRLVVSGAADAWQYRDPAQSDFDEFWRTLIADVAAASPAPLELGFAGGAAARVLAPAERVTLELFARDVALAPMDDGDSVSVNVAANLDGKRVWFWPSVARGRLTADLRAPAEPGTYEVTADLSGATARMPIIVADVTGGTHASAGDRDVVAAWSESRGGIALQAGDTEELVDALRRRIGAERRREPWHPMRSAWWIVPFAALLGAEWLWRRRRGLA